MNTKKKTRTPREVILARKIIEFDDFKPKVNDNCHVCRGSGVSNTWEHPHCGVEIEESCECLYEGRIATPVDSRLLYDDDVIKMARWIVKNYKRK